MSRGPFDVEKDFPLFVTTGDENGPKKIVPNTQYILKLLEKLGIIKFLHVHVSNPPSNNIRDTVWYKPPVSVADQTTQNGTVLIYDSLSASWVDAETHGDAWHRYLTELEPEERPREVLEGAGPPSNSVGKKGDLYVQSNPSRVYYKKADGTWASLAAGAVLLESSSSPPANSFGNDGEYVITPNGVFGPKAGGAWPTTPVSGEHTAAANVPAFASQSQAEAGTNNDTIMTPLRVAQAITVALSANIPPFASQSQAEAGTNNSSIMTPLRVAQYVAANPGSSTFDMCGLPAVSSGQLGLTDTLAMCDGSTAKLATLQQVKDLIHTTDLCTLPAFDPATDTLADADKVIVCNGGTAKQINVSDLRAEFGVPMSCTASEDSFALIRGAASASAWNTLAVAQATTLQIPVGISLFDLIGLNGYDESSAGPRVVDVYMAGYVSGTTGLRLFIMTNQGVAPTGQYGSRALTYAPQGPLPGCWAKVSSFTDSYGDTLTAVRVS